MPIGLLSGIVSFFSGLASRFGIMMMFFAFSSLGSIIKKVLSFIGLSTVVLTGINLVTTKILSNLSGYMAGLSSDVVSMMGIMNLDVALSLIISAGVIKQIMKGFDRATDSKREKVWKTPAAVSNPWTGSGRNF